MIEQRSLARSFNRFDRSAFARQTSAGVALFIALFSPLRDSPAAAPRRAVRLEWTRF